MKSREKTIVLSHEISEVAAALEGVRLLADAIAHEEIGRSSDEPTATRAISAITTLALCRLSLVCDVCRGHVDAALLAGQHNLLEGEKREYTDVYIESWSVKERLARARKELERLQSALDRVAEQEDQEDDDGDSDEGIE